MAKTLEKPTPTSIAAYVKKHGAAVRKAQKHHAMKDVSVREAEFRGHHIVIRTRYDVTVDGTPLMGHLGVSNDGTVHYHPMPNMRFGSAVDLVKQVIDVFPDEFAGRKRGPMHRSMAGMPRMGRAGTRRKTRRK